jgi:dTDP-4-amino-4,6-dideoxygalactose transaminase
MPEPPFDRYPQLVTDERPVILGGSPVRPEGPPSWPIADADVAAAISAAVADGSWGQYLGPHVAQCESTLSELLGVSHAITCASGTLAVEVGLRALGVGPGDEVILAAYDFEPTFVSIHALGATPVLVEVERHGTCLYPDCLAAAITTRTKAIIATHLHGGLASMSAVLDIARQHGVRVLEDAAQAAGGTIEGKPAGTWGDMGVLSFGGSKLVTSGRGGAMVTAQSEIAQRVRLALARGIQQLAPLSEIQAAALVPQLRQLPERTEHRHRMVKHLNALIAEIPGLLCVSREAPESRPAFYKLGYLLDEQAFGLNRDRFVAALRAEGIAFDPGFRALHVGRSPARYKAIGSLEQAEIAGRTVVGLHHPVLSLGIDEVEQVAAALWKTYRNASRLR